MPATVLAHFLRGEERASELTAQLALESGYSLTDIYESLRVGVYGSSLATDERPSFRCVRAR